MCETTGIYRLCHVADLCVGLQWRRQHGSRHNVAFDAVTGRSADIPTTANSTVTRAFGTAGILTYRCTIHSGMTGTVIVQ